LYVQFNLFSMALSKVIGRNIKHIRETKGIKQIHLASILKISPQTLSYMENGRSDISIGKLELIAKALEVNVMDFFSKSHFEDPLAERKKVLEEAAVGLVNMYNDLTQKSANEGRLIRQMDQLIRTQEQVIDLLKELLNLPKEKK
jgi:transcriptional regulator with XRE-family HTH domain